MSEAGFPKPVAEVVATLAEIFRHQRRAEVVELLENSHAWFDNTHYDPFNGGNYTWALRLEVPVSIFASVESRLVKIEKEISEKLGYFSRQYPNEHLNEVTFAPVVPGTSAVGQRITPSDLEVRGLWPDGRFRLFLTHVSEHKVAVSKLKDELEPFGIYAFVAHEAIQPSLEWQRQIELALRSMHALLALITPDFHESFWTDQEIGWALGRGVLFVPVRLGIDPYGFAGKIQGISGTLERPNQLAKAVFDTFLTNPQTHGEMRRALATAFCAAGSDSQAILLRDYVAAVTDFTDAEKAAVVGACETNTQLSNAYRVQETIHKAFGKPTKPGVNAVESDDVPF